MSIQETLGEAAYGRGREYKAPNNDWIYKGLNNAPLGKVNKQKFLTFAENIMAKKKWVPGPGTNQKIDQWDKMLGKNNGKFLKSHRYTIAGEI